MDLFVIPTIGFDLLYVLVVFLARRDLVWTFSWNEGPRYLIRDRNQVYGAAARRGLRTIVMRLTCIAGLSGLPQVTLPIGSLAGCALGLSFIGWVGGDEALLALCVKLSRRCGYAN
jgi:Asp-tRNA(Asn)/Glu-tRNA(Gln) amidotransferase A subunit family amidase